MAIEALVKAEDNVNPNVDPGELWRQGDIVIIKQSPAVWGSLEAPPYFWRITIDGINLDDPAVVTWLETNFTTDGEGNVDWSSRRKVYLDISRLPPPVRNDILNDGYATVPANRLQGFRDAIVPRV